MAILSRLSFETVADWEQLPATLVHRDVADVAIDSRDRVFLFGRHESQVLIYESDGTFVGAWGLGLFANSHGITIGPDDSVYCTDNGNHTVRKFTPDGQLLMTLGTVDVPSDTGYDGRNLESITRPGPPFNRCTNMSVGPNGHLYVSDGYGNARIHRFSPEGELLQSWGEPGTGPGQFHNPHGIFVSVEGRVLVADRENDRIQFFDLDGNYLDAWTDVQRPCAIHIDKNGLVYVAELGRSPGNKSFVHGIIDREMPGRVSVYDPSGAVLARWGGPESCAPGNFAAPHGICVDSRGGLYVAEVTYTFAGRQGLVSPDCHQLQKFIPSADGAATHSNP